MLEGANAAWDADMNAKHIFERSPWGLDAAFMEFGGGVAIRTRTHVYHLAMDGQHQLAQETGFFYDLEADPYQLRNLSSEVDLHPVAKWLDELLRTWHDQTPWLTED